MHQPYKVLASLILASSLSLNACANTRGRSDKVAPTERPATVVLPVDDLAKDGLEMEVHAAVPEYHQFVGTIRQKGDFFIAEQFPLIPGSANLLSTFLKLKRHDIIKVKGELVNPKNPQRHIRVSSLEIVKPWDVELPHHEYELKMPDDLKPKGKIQALVHAVAAQGSVLLIDYRGAIIPVIVKLPNLTKNLYRNDSIELNYILVTPGPGAPPHMMLNPMAKPALRVLYAIKSENQKPGTREGHLVLFPKSPQVQFNVFALEATNQVGLKHNYTLVNFDSTEEFQKIRDKLQAVWDSAPQDKVYNARNRLENPRVLVRAKGIMNEVDPGQANPQVLLKSVDDLEVVIDKN